MSTDETYFHIYGIVTDRNEMISIVYAKAPAEIGQLNILFPPAGNKDSQVVELNAGANPNLGADIFELEVVSSMNEANAALEFWCSYFRFLGLRTRALP